MPFYEYECSACKFYVEALQKVADDPLKKCPSCGKETLHRLISAPVFRLKGSGWYETDFKSDKENKRNLVDSGGDDKEPAAKSDGDDKKVRVRASKALKKVAAKKAARKPAKKAAKNPRAKTAGTNKAAGRQAVRKVTKKATRKAAGKRPAKNARLAGKPARKKIARKK